MVVFRLTLSSTVDLPVNVASHRNVLYVCAVVERFQIGRHAVIVKPVSIGTRHPERAQHLRQRLLVRLIQDLDRRVLGDGGDLFAVDGSVDAIRNEHGFARSVGLDSVARFVHGRSRNFPESAVNKISKCIYFVHTKSVPDSNLLWGPIEPKQVKNC